LCPRLLQLLCALIFTRARHGQLFDAAVDFLGAQVDQTLQTLLLAVTHR